MAKTKTAHAYELELRKMIKARTSAECEIWLTPQIRATAMNMVLLDKIQDELSDEPRLVKSVSGSMGQNKTELHPLLAAYDKMQRTLLMQFESLGLNYSTTPSKVKEDTRKGVDERDPMARMMAEARNALED